MRLNRINRNPSRLQLSVFGIVWLAFFCTVALVARSRGGSQTVLLGIAAAALIVPLVGWVVPSFMRTVYLGMAYLSFPIGFVLSHVLLATVYYLVLAPTGLLMRLIGYDPMKRRFDHEAESYWVPRRDPKSIERYFRQS